MYASWKLRLIAAIRRYCFGPTNETIRGKTSKLFHNESEEVFFNDDDKDGNVGFSVEVLLLDDKDTLAGVVVSFVETAVDVFVAVLVGASLPALTLLFGSTTLFRIERLGIIFVV